MAISRTRTIGVVAVVATSALALRPVAPAERALDVVLLPFRVLASLAVPVGVVQAAEGGRAAAERAARDAADLELHRELERRVRAAAWPTGGLPVGVGAVQAEVVGHDDGDLDVLQLRVAEPARVRRGQPVVAGEGYVGVVTRIPGDEPAAPASPGLLARALRIVGIDRTPPVPPRDVVHVELVTGRDARVGARIAADEDGRSCRVVVGGLAPRDDELQLAVHNPERRAVRAGEVRVNEPDDLIASDGAPRASLANGFLVGQLQRAQVSVRGAGIGAGAAATREVLGVRPWLDYEAGLHQVLVLVPDGVARRAPAPERTVLSDGGWSPARFFVRAEPSPRREGRKLDRGRRHDVREGAALTSGARLVGRVVRAGLVTSDVALPGDEGFVLNAIAEPLVPGTGDVPLPILGRMVSLGRSGDGTVRFEVTLHRDLAAPYAAGAAFEALAVPARIWTGSGEPGVPRGLLLGTAELPLEAGRHVIALEQAAGARDPRGLRVRVPGAVGGGRP